MKEAPNSNYFFQNKNKRYLFISVRILYFFIFTSMIQFGWFIYKTDIGLLYKLQLPPTSLSVLVIILVNYPPEEFS
jgi:hypothetical protein